MKISELILQLEEARRTVGDVEVQLSTNSTTYFLKSGYWIPIHNQMGLQRTLQEPPDHISFKISRGLPLGG